jgi:hypothetical protein
MTAILVRFEWHGDCPGSGTPPSSYTVHLSPPTTDPCNKATHKRSRIKRRRRCSTPLPQHIPKDIQCDRTDHARCLVELGGTFQEPVERLLFQAQL